MSGQPFPKSAQLARGERRYRRKIASPKQWQAIIAAKGRACRIQPCEGPSAIEYHHLISRSQGGDDVADNVVPLCRNHHAWITARAPVTLAALADSLTEPERAYVGSETRRGRAAPAVRRRCVVNGMGGGTDRDEQAATKISDPTVSPYAEFPWPRWWRRFAVRIGTVAEEARRARA